MCFVFSLLIQLKWIVWSAIWGGICFFNTNKGNRGEFTWLINPYMPKRASGGCSSLAVWLRIRPCLSSNFERTTEWKMLHANFSIQGWKSNKNWIIFLNSSVLYAGRYIQARYVRMYKYGQIYTGHVCTIIHIWSTIYNCTFMVQYMRYYIYGHEHIVVNCPYPLSRIPTKGYRV